MPTKKRRLSQAQKAAIPKLRELKKLGLFGGRVRAPSKYGVSQTKKFSDVLTGKAAVVTAPPKAVREYRAAGRFKVKGRKIVVPKEKGERVKYDKKLGAISSTRETYGQRVKTVKPPRGGETMKAPRGKRKVYVIPIGPRRFRFTSRAELEKFMRPYEQGTRPYEKWREYVEIEFLDRDDDLEDEE